MSDFDLIVLGAGPGGYVAAIRAAQLGFKTAVVEKRTTLGGTCLNVGCIPSKALLHSSEKYAEALHHLDEHGVSTGSVKLDLKKMLTRKEGVVKDLTKGIEFLFKKNKITWLQGAGTIDKAGQVTVTDGKDNGTYTCKNILIATGSKSAELPGVTVDEKTVVSSTGALEINKVPKTMVVIGGGYIGLELGSVWQRLGTQVTVIEYLDRIVPTMDGEVAKTFHKVLEKQGMTFKLGTKVTSVEAGKSGAKLTVEPAKGGDAEKIKADIVLLSIGRTPFTEGLGLEQAGVQMNERGYITVDENYQTSTPGIYAIGDVIPGPMLAHKAEEEGVVCVEKLAGQKPHMNYDCIPGVVYTSPEVASVGKTEEELKAAGIAYNVGKFPFMANSRARSTGNTEGFVKLLADSKTDKLLGAHIIGHEAGTLIAELALALEFGASAEDVARTCHAHPTMEEAIKEAALAVDKRPIHV